MRMNNIFKFTALLAGVAMLTTGCIQETVPMNGGATMGQIENSDFAGDGLIAAVSTILVTNNVYGADFHEDFGYPTVMVTGDFNIGEVFASNFYDGGNPMYSHFLYYNYQLSIGPNGYCGIYWNHYYKFIKIANDVLVAYGNATEGPEFETASVARAFRALYYLDLARYYDPLPAKATAKGKEGYEAELQPILGLTVPIVDENTTEESSKNNPRVPREEMFQFIFNDLNSAEVGLANYKPAAKNLPTLAVIYGLKARAYLWLGGFEENLYDTEKYPDVVTGNAAYKKAAEYARLAITTSSCTPLTEQEYCDPRTGFNKANNAWMWAMLQSTETMLSQLHNWAAHMSCQAGWGYGGICQYGVRKKTYERMSNSDFRKKIIVGPNASYDDYKNVTTFTEEEWESFGMEGTGVHTYAHMKFRTNGGEKVNAEIGAVVDIPLMRVEEMYLIEAEATAHFDSSKGKQLTEAFMAYRDPKYSFPVTASTTDEIVEEIIFQKRCELWGEGVLFFDFKRLDMGIENGYEGTNTPNGQDFQTEGRCPSWNICIPISEMQQNKALVGKNNPDPSATIDPMTGVN